jgi:WD40 repeat protein
MAFCPGAATRNVMRALPFLPERDNLRALVCGGGRDGLLRSKGFFGQNESEGFVMAGGILLERRLGSNLLRPHGKIEALAAHPDGNSLWVLSLQDESAFFRKVHSSLSRWDVQSGELLEEHDTLFPMRDASLLLESGHPFIAAYQGLYRSTPRGIEQICSLNSPCSLSEDLLSVLFASYGEQLTLGQRFGVKEISLELAAEKFCLAPDAGSLVLCSNGTLEGWSLHPQKKVLWLFSKKVSRRWRILLEARPQKLTYLSSSLVLALFEDALLGVDPDSGAERWRLSLIVEESRSSHNKIAISDNKQTIAIIGEAHIYIVSANGELLSSIERELQINGVALAPDASWLAMTNGEVVSLHPLSSKKVFARDGHTGAIVGLQWFGDGRRLLALANEERSVSLWDCDTGESNIFIDSGQSAIGLRLSPDEGTTLLLQQSEMNARLLFFDKEGFAQETRNLGNPIKCVAISPDGARLYFLERGLLESENPNVGEDMLLAEAFRDPFGRALAQNGFYRYHLVSISLEDRLAEPIREDIGYQNPFSLQSNDTGRVWVFCAKEVTSVKAPGLQQIESGVLLEYVKDTDSLRLLEGFALKDHQTIISRVFAREGNWFRQKLCMWKLREGREEWSISLEKQKYLSERAQGCLWISQGERWGFIYNNNTIRFFLIHDGSLWETLSLEEIPGATKLQITIVEISKDERRLAVGTAQGVILLFRLVGLPE